MTRHSGGEIRQGSEADEPKGFDLLDEHIKTICNGAYGETNVGHDYFPAEVNTLAKRRVYVLQQSPDILDALQSAYADKDNSFLPKAVSGIRHQGTLEALAKSKTR